MIRSDDGFKWRRCQKARDWWQWTNVRVIFKKELITVSIIALRVEKKTDDSTRDSDNKQRSDLTQK